MFFTDVIFDLDGTLYDYDLCHHNALNEALCEISKISGKDIFSIKEIYDEVNLNLKKQILNTASSHNRIIYFKQIIDKLGLPLTHVEKINDLYWKEYYKYLTLNDGVMDMITFFRSHNIKIHILTDFVLSHQLKKLNKLGILNLIDNVISSEENGVEKPDTKVFTYCLNKIKCELSDVVLIGDDFDKDIIGALNANIYPFHYTKMKGIKILEKYTTFDNFKNLLDYFIIHHH